jgi:hypothetical protein
MTIIPAAEVLTGMGFGMGYGAAPPREKKWLKGIVE